MRGDKGTSSGGLLSELKLNRTWPLSNLKDLLENSHPVGGWNSPMAGALHGGDVAKS